MIDAARCGFCGWPFEGIDVHGHVQCSRCGINADPCCAGACAGPGLAATERRAGPAERHCTSNEGMVDRPADTSERERIRARA